VKPKTQFRLSGSTRPLVWVTIALTGGILFAALNPGWGLLPLFVLIPISFATGLAAAFTRTTIWLTISLLTLASVMGFVRSRSQELTDKQDVSNLASSSLRISGEIVSDPEEYINASGGRPGRERFTLQAERAQIVDSGASVSVTGLVEVSVPISAAYDQALQFGDLVTICGSLERPTGPRNPGGRDDRAELGRRGLLSRLTIFNPSDCTWLHAAKRQPRLLQPIYALKHVLMAHNRRALTHERAGVLSAIMFGAKSELSASNRDHFAKTGTMHLLATAGYIRDWWLVSSSMRFRSLECPNDPLFL